MKNKSNYLLLAVFLASFSFAIEGQIADQSNISQENQTKIRKEQEKVDDKTVDVAITARVQARELKFEVVPNPSVDFFGSHKRKTEWSSERENLPENVQPGVTYRNIGIRLKIVSVFADIDRIVAEALGETLKTEEDPKNKPLQTQPTIDQNKKPRR